MYAMTFSKPTPPSARARRDDAMPPPASGSPASDAETTAASSVSAVTPVAATRKRYRAVVCRTIYEKALVEFEADETVDMYSAAEQLVPQIPAESWTRSDTESYAYIDRIEETGPAGTAPDAAAETLSADAPMADEDEYAPGGAAAEQRLSAEEVTLAVQDIADAAEQAQINAAPTVEGVTDLLATLQALRADLEALQSEPLTDDLPDEDAAASELVASTLGVLDEMIALAEESKAALEDEAAAQSATAAA